MLMYALQIEMEVYWNMS